MISIGVLHGPWLPCAALVLVGVVVWRGPRVPANELWIVIALSVGAAVARFVWGLWGPLHINGQGPLWIRGALEHGALGSYGPGYFELFNRVAHLGGAPDRAIFTANALLSAVSPALLYAAARLAGVGRGGALAAAVVLAADAVTVRTAATEGYFSSLIVLLIGVQASLALGVQAQLRRDTLGASLALVAACLLAAALARIHPVAYLPLTLCPLIVFAATSSEGWGKRVAFAVGAGAAMGAMVLLSSGTTVITAVRASPMTSHAFAGITWRQAELTMVLLVIVWLVRRWAQPPWLPMLGVLSLLLMLATREAFGQHPLWELCYARLFWPGLLLGSAAILSGIPSSWALGSATVVAVGVLVSALPHLGTPTTEQLEYRFLQEVLRDMPPGCTLASVSRVGQRVWDIPSYLLPGLRRDESPYLVVERPSDLREAVISGDCLLYVRSSLCSSIEARSLCESVEREVQLERVAGRVFPASPSYLGRPYDRSGVDVAIFRVRGHGIAAARDRPALGAGTAITPAFAQALSDRLMPLRAPDGCRVVRVDTSRFLMTIGVQARPGQEHVLDVANEPDRGDVARKAGGWALAASADLQRDCGTTLAAIEHVLSDLQTPTAAGGVDLTDRRHATWAGVFLLAAAGLLLGLAAGIRPRSVRGQSTKVR